MRGNSGIVASGRPELRMPESQRALAFLRPSHSRHRGPVRHGHHRGSRFWFPCSGRHPASPLAHCAHLLSAHRRGSRGLIRRPRHLITGLLRGFRAQGWEQAAKGRVRLRRPEGRAILSQFTLVGPLRGLLSFLYPSPHVLSRPKRTGPRG